MTRRRWIADDDSQTFVACNNAGVVGVAALQKSGIVTLNYVLPDVRFTGVSAALLARVETAAVAMRLDHLKLSSTQTARRFYLRHGFVETDLLAANGGSGISMTKRLARAATKGQSHAPCS